MYRTLLGIVAAIIGTLAAALVVVVFTFATSKDRADFVFWNGSDPKTLDPQKMTGQPEGRIAEAIYEGLTAYDPETLKPVPGVAESWEQSPDGLKWTFHLRSNARWSNGAPVTAHDFVYAWVRFQEPKVASEYAYLIHFVKHAEAYNTYGAQVDALEGNAKSETPEGKEGILQGLRGLLAKRPSGLPAQEWQAFVAARAVRDAVTRTKDPAILGAFETNQGTLSPEQGRTLLSALDAEASTRKEALAQAQAHYGKDEGVYAPDARTFVVELRTFTPFFLELTAFYPTHPVHPPTVEAHPEDFFLPQYSVCNGPFVLETWDVAQKIRLRKNPLYWDSDKVSLEVIDAIPYDDTSQAFKMYEAGEIDWAPSGYPPDLIDAVKKRPDYYSEPGMIVYYYRLNCTRPPFDDPRVRRAIGLAFDRQLVVDKVLRAGQIPATTYVAPGVPGYESPPSLLGFDPKEAKRLLNEATGGRGIGRSVSILFNTHEGHRKIAEFIAGQLRENLGIDAVPRNEEWQQYQETTRLLEYDIARAAWIGDYRDPNTFLDMWVTKGGNNQTGWGDPTYDRLIALAADPISLATMPAAEREAILAKFRERPRGEELLRAVEAATEPAARLEAAAALRLHLFREAEAILFQDAFPIIPIYFYVVTGLKSPRIHGFHTKLREGDRMIPNLQDIHPLKEIRMGPPDTESASSGGS